MGGIYRARRALEARGWGWNLPGISRNLPDNLPSLFKNNFEESDFVIFVRSLQWLLQLQACANRNGAREARASFERTFAATYVASLHHGLKRAADALA